MPRTPFQMRHSGKFKVSRFLDHLLRLRANECRRVHSEARSNRDLLDSNQRAVPRRLLSQNPLKARLCSLSSNLKTRRRSPARRAWSLGKRQGKQIALVRNSTEGAAVRAMVRRCGEICLSDSKCIRLIEHLLAAGGEGVVVKNDLAPPEEFVEQSRPRSCFLAPIQTAL